MRKLKPGETFTADNVQLRIELDADGHQTVVLDDTSGAEYYIVNEDTSENMPVAYNSSTRAYEVDDESEDEPEHDPYARDCDRYHAAKDDALTEGGA